MNRSEQSDVNHDGDQDLSFSHREQAIERLHPAGPYDNDNLQPQPNGPDGQAPKLAELIADFERLSEFVGGRRAWASKRQRVDRKAS